MFLEGLQNLKISKKVEFLLSQDIELVRAGLMDVTYILNLIFHTTIFPLAI